MFADLGQVVSKFQFSKLFSQAYSQKEWWYRRFSFDHDEIAELYALGHSSRVRVKLRMTILPIILTTILPTIPPNRQPILKIRLLMTIW